MNPTPAEGDVACVRAPISFVDDVAGPLVNYFDVEPPAGVPKRIAQRQIVVSVTDARRAKAPSWGREGFTMLADEAGVIADYRDPALLEQVYDRAIERMVGQITGARRAIVFDHTYRSTSVTTTVGGAATDTPVDQAHNDYTPASGPERVREMLARFAPDENAGDVLARRYAIVNVWRPTNGEVEQWPLALCDQTTIGPDDFASAELRWSHRTGYVAVLRHRPEQRWFYFPKMHSGEVLVFTCFDSAGRAGRLFGAHTAFNDPTTQLGAKPRESLEVRVLALF